MTYFHPDGPLGGVFRTLSERKRPIRTAVVGLGAGSIAAYGRAGDRMKFIEIDPVIAEIAGDPSLFSFLSQSRARIEVVIGDGRLVLQEFPRHTLDLLVIDAFSSDAIPTHLLTREAIALDLETLAPGGLLVFNLTNRYLDLARVVGGAARALGVHTFIADDPTERPPERSACTWVALARAESDLRPLRTHDARWHPLDREGLRVWTDDYTSVWGLFR
jgi:spermidine synthase